MATAHINALTEYIAKLDVQDSKADTFLKTNKVHSDWITFINEHSTLLGELNKSLKRLERFGDGTNYIPAQNLILKALTFCPPADIKVVLLAHDPIPDRNLATGLAFSFPEGTADNKIFVRSAMFKMHTALRSVSLLGTESASCCHESWAKKGVLLLNAVLTVKQPGGDYKKHYKAWINFTKALVHRLCEEIKDLYIICWGTNAKEIADGLNDINAYKTQCTPTCKVKNHASCRLFVSDHPTFPRNDENNFPVEGPKQFKIIDRRFPGIFN